MTIHDTAAVAQKSDLRRMREHSALMRPLEVAKVVWEAYRSDKLHWYVPDEIGELDKAAENSPEVVRDQIASTLTITADPPTLTRKN